MSMTEAEEKVIDLMKKKCEALKSVLEYTKGAVFRGTDTDADIYVSVMAKREEFFNRMYSLDAELEKSAVRQQQGDKSSPVYALEISSIESEMKTIIDEIMKHETVMNETALRMHIKLKKSIKDLRNGKNIRAKYNNGYINEHQYSRFNSSR